MNRPRPLGFWDAACIGVNAIVGSSIFLFPGKLAALLGPASVLSFGLTALLLSSVALCFAEAAGRFETSGGPYVYARAAFGDSAGFGIGWMCWATSILSWAAVANAVSLYLGYFGPGWTTPMAVKATAGGVIVLLTALNYRGVRQGAWASNFFTAAKLAPLLILALAGLPALAAASPGPIAPHGWAPMGKACFLAYFAFQGFEVVPVPSGEVADARRNVPRALLAAMALAAVLYMVIQSVAVAAHPGLAGSERPLAEVAERLLGPAGAALIVAGAVCSTVGFNAGTALAAPRYLTPLAEDGHLPGWLGGLHPIYGTPHRAILLTSGLALAAALGLDFARLVDFSNVVVCAQYLATCAAIPFLRKKLGRGQGYQVPGGILLPLAGIAATLWLGGQGDLAQIRWSLGLLALGFVLRGIFRLGGMAHGGIS